MLWKRIIVGDQERALITKNGCFGGILAPGEYRLFVPPGVSLDVEKYNVRDLVFQSTWADYLAKERPEVAERHFTRIETNNFQVAMIYVDGELFKVMLPAKRLLFWRGAMQVTAEVVNVIDDPQLPAQKLPALERLGKESFDSFLPGRGSKNPFVEYRQSICAQSFTRQIRLLGRDRISAGRSIEPHSPVRGTL
jgi:hypothetical protein